MLRVAGGFGFPDILIIHRVPLLGGILAMEAFRKIKILHIAFAMVSLQLIPGQLSQSGEMRILKISPQRLLL